MNRQGLIDAIRAKGSFLCVGLDPELHKLPTHLQNQPDAILEFNKAIIDATREYAVAYKPNIAFYEALGPDGWHILGETLAHIGNEHFTIADAKRGDIGNTSRKYAETFFETYHFDSITIAPYMGRDSVEPFLSFPEKWAIVLALTSNAGADDFQFTEDSESGKLLYTKVLERVSHWGNDGNTMFVVGATRPEMLAKVREVVPNHFLLVPGVGAQGGSLADVCDYGLNSDVGLLINSSRGIIYASGGKDFAEAAASEAKALATQMKSILQKKSLL